MKWHQFGPLGFVRLNKHHIEGVLSTPRHWWGFEVKLTKTPRRNDV